MRPVGTGPCFAHNGGCLNPTLTSIVFHLFMWLWWGVSTSRPVACHIHWGNLMLVDTAIGKRWGIDLKSVLSWFEFIITAPICPIYLQSGPEIVTLRMKCHVLTLSNDFYENGYVYRIRCSLGNFNLYPLTKQTLAVGDESEMVLVL